MIFQIIKHTRTFILRCYTCFTTTSDVTKIFCRRCGHKTLKRVSVSIDQNGKQVVRFLVFPSFSTFFHNFQNFSDPHKHPQTSNRKIQKSTNSCAKRRKTCMQSNSFRRSTNSTTTVIEEGDAEDKRVR